MEKVKLGIIGIGNMGTGHALNLIKGEVPEIELTAVADLKEARRKWAEKELPDSVHVYETGEELIESGVCDAVLVAVPHYDHPRFCIMAMQHELHVICEKPAGVYTKQVREMNEEAAKHDVVFAMMFNQRTNHVYRKMHELVHSENMGPSNVLTGLLLIGIVLKLIIILEDGVRLGAEKVAVFFSTNVHIIWILCNGFVVCHLKCRHSAMRENGMI